MRQDSREQIISRIEGKVERITESGCWVWLGGSSPQGYGYMRNKGKMRKAHRVSYETFVGEIPAGLEIHHVCEVRSCVNPKHLRPVTRKQNCNLCTNPKGFFNMNKAKTHCIAGHSLSGMNLYLTPNGRRQCKTCSRRRELRSKERGVGSSQHG